MQSERIRLMWIKKLPLIFLGLFTLLAFFAVLLSLAPDPEGKLFWVGFGGMLVLFAAPFWIIYRGRIPFLVVLFALILLYAGIIYLDCWACIQAGTKYIHPADHASMWLYMVPGALTALAHWLLARRIRPAN